MQIEGTVIENNGATSLVVVYRSSACGGDCGHNCATCGAAKRLEVEADNGGFSPKKGDLATLESSTDIVIGLAMLVYILPIVTGIIGYYAAVRQGEGTRALTALVGFLIGFVPAMIVNRRIASSGRPTHKITAVRPE